MEARPAVENEDMWTCYSLRTKTTHGILTAVARKHHDAQDLSRPSGDIYFQTRLVKGAPIPPTHGILTVRFNLLETHHGVDPVSDSFDHQFPSTLHGRRVAYPFAVREPSRWFTAKPAYAIVQKILSWVRLSSHNRGPWWMKPWLEYKGINCIRMSRTSRLL